MDAQNGLTLTGQPARVFRRFPLEARCSLDCYDNSRAAGVRLGRSFRPIRFGLLGWVSDNIGRENTMFIAFLAEGIGIWILYLNAIDPLLFVLLSGVVFLGL